MSQNEVEYLTRRARQPRDRSSATGDPAAKRLHEELAASYLARATRLAGRETA